MTSLFNPWINQNFNQTTISCLKHVDRSNFISIIGGKSLIMVAFFGHTSYLSKYFTLYSMAGSDEGNVLFCTNCYTNLTTEINNLMKYIDDLIEKNKEEYMKLINFT